MRRAGVGEFIEARFARCHNGFKHGNAEPESFSCAGLSLADNIVALECNREGQGLDWKWVDNTFFAERVNNLAADSKVREGCLNGRTGFLGHVCLKYLECYQVQAADRALSVMQHVLRGLLLPTQPVFRLSDRAASLESTGTVARNRVGL